MLKYLIAGLLLPHPPIMIPEIGQIELDKMVSTVQAAKRAAEIICASELQTVVIMSPHGPAFHDAVSINLKPQLRGSFSTFGAPEVVLELTTDNIIANNIIRKAEEIGVQLITLTTEIAKNYQISLELDHGALVPLYYLHQAGFNGQIVHLGVGDISLEKAYSFGQAVQAAINESERKVAVVASGDLSHRLAADGPYGYHPSGPEFDRQIVKALANSDVKAILNMDKKLIEEAGQCGLRSILFLFGVMDGSIKKPEIISYEGPFGVGYAVVLFLPGCTEQSRLARDSIIYYLEYQAVMPVAPDLPEILKKRAGVFVSLKKNGRLRGCIGTFMPQQENTAQEIIQNAVSASTQDPRFLPVRREELDEIDISVDVLSPPEKVIDQAELDVKKYGVIVKAGWRTGLLLPDLEGVETPEHQLKIAREKAGIGLTEAVEIYRFTVTRYK